MRLEESQKLERVYLLADLKKFDAALKLLSTLLAEDPEDEYLHYLMGRILFLKGDSKAAKEVLSQVLGKTMVGAEAHHLTGLIYMDERMLKKAEKHLHEAVSLRPDYDEYWTNLGSLYLQKSDFTNAEKSARLALDVDATNETAQNVLFWTYIQMGFPARAKSIVKQNLAQNPENVETLINYGNLLNMREDHKGATEVFRSVLQNQPELEEPLIQFKHASTADNPVTRFIENDQKLGVLKTIGFVLFVFFGFILLAFRIDMRARWILLPLLLQVAVTPFTAKGFGKWYSYVREKGFRPIFNRVELANATLLLTLFVAAMVSMVFLFLDLASEEPFPLNWMLTSCCLVIFQVSLAIRVDWSPHRMIVRRASLLLAAAMAVLSIYFDFDWG